MKIDSTDASQLFQPPQQRQPQHQVQDVFSKILEEAGQRGYASAQETESELPVSEQIETTWSNWFDSEIHGRYATRDNRQELKQGYGELLLKAHSENAYVKPQEFLSSLSKDELKTVQTVHSLAAPIDANGLTEEGALNLLLPPPAQVDLNNDGLTRSGVGFGIRFPDSNTPPEVTAAWEEATAGMPIQEKMMYELRMKLPLLTANIVLDANGAFSHVVEPGDPAFKNPLAEPGYSYIDATQDWLDNLEFAKNLISPERYDQDKDFWTRFQGLLREEGAR